MPFLSYSASCIRSILAKLRPTLGYLISKSLPTILLGMLVNLLENPVLPLFTVDPSQIRILRTPREFYQTLLDNAKTAKRRIVLSTLYIGTGQLELDLVNAIEEAVAKRGVKLQILLDSSRGIRHSSLTQLYAGINQYQSLVPGSIKGNTITSSCDLLAPLTSFNSVSISLYHNPRLRGWLHSFLPSRMNEVLGVQHIKAYVFDDSVILSGANLSHDYFVNRQDRAWVFERIPPLADFYCGLIHTISEFSYRLHPDGTLWPSTSSTDPMKSNLKAFRQNFRSAIQRYLSHAKKRYSCSYRHDFHTYLMPVVQFGPYDIRNEEFFMRQLFDQVTVGVQNSYTMSLVSGYLNLTSSYEQFLINFARHRPDSSLEFLCASPTANGFLNSRGLSGYIPMAYRESLIRLISRLRITFNTERTVPEIFEYSRPEWTFHAKGFWVDEIPQSPTSIPSAFTLIGSSNFSYRSLNRDLESQLVVWTKDARLREYMLAEKNSLFSSLHCQPVILHKLISQAQFRLPWYLRFMLPVLHMYM